ncbi:tyrosine-protein phosphatase [Salmonella enterica]|nr:tyrosine-protein phosphatase [Salmonella enterica]
MLVHTEHRYRTPNSDPRFLVTVRLRGILTESFRYYASRMTGAVNVRTRPVTGEHIIAAECPTRECLFEYYAMLLQENIQTVFILCDPAEFISGRQLDYYSVDFSEYKHGGWLQVTGRETGRQPLSGLQVHYYTMYLNMNQGALNHTVNVVKLAGWQDGRGITCEQLSDWVDLVRYYINGPFVVHCSAGRGRTGVTLAALHLRENPNSRPETVCSLMSQNRGVGMPQTPVQKELLKAYARDLRRRARGRCAVM